MSSDDGKYTSGRLPAALTQPEQPVSFADDAADASGVDVPHELPQQGTERGLCSHQLFHVRDANTDWFLCWSVLEVTHTEIKKRDFFGLFFFLNYIFWNSLLFLFLTLIL